MRPVNSPSGTVARRRATKWPDIGRAASENLREFHKFLMISDGTWLNKALMSKKLTSSRMQKTLKSTEPLPVHGGGGGLADWKMTMVVAPRARRAESPLSQADVAEI